MNRMIKCNSPYSYMEECIFAMDAQQTSGGNDIAEECEFREYNVLTYCEYSEEISEEQQSDECFDELLSDICDNYCKYLSELPNEVWENVSDDICGNCPVSKIAESRIKK